jgi:hypothetical protein
MQNTKHIHKLQDKKMTGIKTAGSDKPSDNLVLVLWLHNSQQNPHQQCGCDSRIHNLPHIMLPLQPGQL